jgi:hypothetical protein
MRTPFRRNCPAAELGPPTSLGVGGELKALLRKFRIVDSAGCACEEKARMMDENGPDWCEENLEVIVEWLHQEAKRRRLKVPFARTGARVLVRYAISRARKKLKAMEEKDQIVNSIEAIVKAGHKVHIPDPKKLKEPG